MVGFKIAAIQTQTCAHYIKVVPADGEVEVWHKDVHFFKVLGKSDNQPRAYFYLDPYTRPAEKRGGAWMDDVVGRSTAMVGVGVS